MDQNEAPRIDSPLLRKVEEFLDEFTKSNRGYAREFDDATLAILIYEYVKWTEKQKQTS